MIQETDRNVLKMVFDEILKMRMTYFLIKDKEEPMLYAEQLASSLQVIIHQTTLNYIYMLLLYIYKYMLPSITNFISLLNHF